MKRINIILVAGSWVIVAASAAQAQTSWGSALKSVTQTAVQQLCPQAQTTVDQAKKLATGAQQENFILTKAKQFLSAGNYQPALDLANYVMTTLNSKSIDARKIMADAKAALMKMAQDKLSQPQAGAGAGQQVKTDVVQAVNGVKGLFGK
jgi:hypothetical protein